MKKILISLAALMSVTTMAKKLPVNIQVGISTGYDSITIKHEDFTKVGLGNIIKGDYKSNAITTGINFDVTYPLNFKKIKLNVCLLYTSPSPRDRQKSRMPSSA